MKQIILGVVLVIVMLVAPALQAEEVAGPGASSATVTLQQPSSDGTTLLTITKVKQRGPVITVQGTIERQSPSDERLELKYKEAYLIDLADQKKYMTLKDEKDNVIAGPIDNSAFGGHLNREMDPEQKVTFWVKFPAPGSEPEKIDLYLPGFAPFEELPVLR